jgi:hypothetical protein
VEGLKKVNAWIQHQENVKHPRLYFVFVCTFERFVRRVTNIVILVALPIPSLLLAEI